MSMIEVSKEQFFKVIGPVNVHPRPERSYTEWASLNTRQLVGRFGARLYPRSSEGRPLLARRSIRQVLTSPPTSSPLTGA